MNCTAEGCDQAQKGRGLCRSHYMKMWRSDRTGLKARFGSSDLSRSEKFWARVAVSDGASCWEWQGRVTPNGYGRVKSGERMVMAHRFSYEDKVGAIDDGLFIDHKCHNRRCVNPAHLQVVTRKENNENLVGATRTSTSGVRGVYPYRGRWRAQVAKHYLGTFDTIAEAEAVAVAGRNSLFTNSLYDQATPDAPPAA